MMNIRNLTAFMLLLVGLFLGISAHAVRAQEDNVDITATPLFQIDQELCPPTGYCTARWRLSPSGDRLLTYFPYTMQLYTLDKDGTTRQYDLSIIPSVTSANFCFVPYSEDSILFYNGFDQKIYKYDLNTQTMTEYLPGHLFVTCNSDTTPPIRTFVRPVMSNWLVVCGEGSSTGDNRNISVVDLTTDTIHEIGTMNDLYPTERLDPWGRVFGGYDGSVYVIFAAFTLQELLPDFIDDPMVYSIFKRGIGDTEWSRIDIPLAQLPELTSTAKLGALAGVDGDGNLYFYRFFGDQVGFEPQFAKVTAQGQVVWMLPATVFGESTHFIDVDAEGNLITVDMKQFDTTEGLSVVQYTVCPHPIEDVPSDNQNSCRKG